MRGEHAALNVMRSQKKGSSPHARGALVRAVTLGAEQGIIPACAGSTRCR